MAAYNATRQFRHANGGKILTAADGTPPATNEIKGIVAGSLDIQELVADRWVFVDQSTLGTVYEGDAKQATIKFKVKKATIDTIISSINLGATAGVVNLLMVTIEYYTNAGGTTGYRKTYRKCYTADGFGIKANGGSENDDVEISLLCNDPSAAWAAF